MINEEIITAGIELVKVALSQSTIEVAFDQILADDEDTLYFTVKLLPKPFDTDEGTVTPSETTLDLSYERDSKSFQMIVSEDAEWDISRGNIYCFLYWNNCGDAVEPDDTKRLDWLSSQQCIKYEHWNRMGGVSIVQLSDSSSDEAISEGQTLRHAIDSAMKSA